MAPNLSIQCKEVPGPLYTFCVGSKIMDKNHSSRRRTTCRQIGSHNFGKHDLFSFQLYFCPLLLTLLLM